MARSTKALKLRRVGAHVRMRDSPLRCGFLSRWEPDAGNVTSRQAPPSRSVGGGDGAAVLVNDAFRDGEPKAGALGVETGGYESFEDVGKYIGEDAGAVVFDCD